MIPQETAATWSLSTLSPAMERARIQARQSCSATQAPVMAAVRVPPSACSTSQSTMIWRSPSALRSTTARSERPMRRWISSVRPPWRPVAASRRVRSCVARGSMPYSAVTQPRPAPRSQPGTCSERLAVHSTCVSPKRTRHEPSACLEYPRSRLTRRSSSGSRFDGRMQASRDFGRGGVLSCAALPVKLRLANGAGGFNIGGGDANELGLATHMSSDGLVALDNRARDIFRSIVESYLETGDPVGSRNVSRILTAALSPASVRNVMADLEELGLIYSPHASAGRLPTEMGLRFFIDSLMEVGELSDEERHRIDQEVSATTGVDSAETLLSEAGHMLSAMSHGAGVVLAGKQDVRVKHVEFVRIEPTRVLAVLVAESGAIENRIIDVPGNLPISSLVEAANYLNAHFVGRTLAEARRELELQRDERRREIDRLTEKVIAAGVATWSGATEDSGTLIVRGMSNLIGDVRAVDDLERIKLLFDDLESKKDIIQVLGLAEHGEGVRIFIGSENKLFSLSGSSLVVAPFRDSGERVVGVLGVIGPTRLNYARVVPAVNYTAQLLTQLLGR